MFESRLRIRLAGLMSRWTMPCLWAKASPLQISMTISTRCRVSSGARRRISSASVSPGMYSMAMNGWPSCSPTS